MLRHLDNPPPNLLPRTGQTTSYDTGDDGQYEAGRPGPARTAELIDLGDGTCFDPATNLTWPIAPHRVIPGSSGLILAARGTWSGLTVSYVVGDLVQGDGAPDSLFYICLADHVSGAGNEPPNATYWVATTWTASAANLTTPATFLWAAALAAAEALDYAGHTDWRLPNAWELLSVGNASGVGPAMFLVPIVAAVGFYWSATTVAGASTYAYRAYFEGSTIALDINLKATVAWQVLPVRGGIVNG